MRAAALAIAMIGVPVASGAGGGVFVSVAIAPPPIPVYVQPVAPAPGYIWTPGYWAYGPDGYYWVPGAWVLPPYVGALWTPGYWGWSNGVYVWNAGYWGTRVGFYGGINYGFGYTGYGYRGGYWRGDAFHYNVAANNVDRNVVRNTYNTTINNVNTTRVSYQGGAGGTRAQPDAAQRAYMRQAHRSATAVQVQHEQAAAREPALRASVNHGRPANVALANTGTRGDSGAMTTTTARARNSVANADVNPRSEQPRHQNRVAPAGPPQTQSRAQTQPMPQRQVQAQPAPQRHVQPQPAPQRQVQAPRASPSHAGRASPQPDNARAAPQRYAQVAPQGERRGHAPAAMDRPAQGKPQASGQRGGKNGHGDGGEGHRGK